MLILFGKGIVILSIDSFMLVYQKSSVTITRLYPSKFFFGVVNGGFGQELERVRLFRVPLYYGDRWLSGRTCRLFGRHRLSLIVITMHRSPSSYASLRVFFVVMGFDDWVIPYRLR